MINIIEYNRHVQELFSTPLPPPVTCGANLHCAEKVYCYNNYHPHFNPGLHLHSLVVGLTDWTYVNRTSTPTQRWVVTQYQDFKEYYSSSRSAGEIHFRVNVSNASRAVQFCGDTKNAVFYVDTNVPASRLHSSYTPTNSGSTSTATTAIRLPWSKISQPLCTELSGLPVGSHVVSVAKNATNGADVVITHVLMWA